MVKTALRPSYFDPYKEIGTLKKETAATEEDLVESKSIHELAESRGWAFLSAYIDRLKTELEGLNIVFIEKGASFDDIGRNTVMIALCKEFLTKIQNKVIDAHDEIESSGRTAIKPNGEQ